MKLIISTFIKEPGGIAQSFLDYCKVLSDRGHEVHAFVRGDMPLSFRRKTHKYCKKMYMFKPRGYYDIISLVRMWVTIRLIKADAIVAHGNRASSLIRRAAKGLKAPCITVCHSYNVARSIGMDGVIALSPHMHAHIVTKGQPADKCYIIPNMIYLADKQGISTKTPPHKTITIGTMAELHPNKGIHHVIAAISQLRQKGINCNLRIAGEGAERKNLEAQVSALNLNEHVKFLGWIDDKKSFFNSIDIFCLASLSERFGIVILEAVAYYAPVLGTKGHGPSYLIEDGKNGLLCEIDSTESIASQLEKLIHNPHLWQALSKAGFENALKFSMLNVGKELEKTLQSVINKHHERRA